MTKNIEWLKNEVNELPLRFLGFSMLKQREEFTVSKDDVLELIDQLDEPEVLSQEWIDKHTYYEDEYDFYYADPDELKNLLVPKQEVLSREWIDENKSLINGRSINPDGTEGECYDAHYIHVLELQNLLVPKQELPVIPKFVAEWLDDNIERYDTVYSFIISLVEVFGDTVPEKVWTYASENPDTMARAYLDGYTVEEELLYRLKAGKNYLYFKNDGSVQTVTKKNATINKERLEKLPFDLEQALDSGIIELEEIL